MWLSAWVSHSAGGPSVPRSTIAVGISIRRSTVSLLISLSSISAAASPMRLVRHPHCGQTRIDDGRNVDVVKPGDRHVLRNMEAHLARLLHGTDGEHIVAADHRRRARRFSPSMRRRRRRRPQTCMAASITGKRTIRHDSRCRYGLPHTKIRCGSTVVHIRDATDHADAADGRFDNHHLGSVSSGGGAHCRSRRNSRPGRPGSRPRYRDMPRRRR
jgi:hypothetical protein